MNGSVILNDDEKQEMMEDAKDIKRGKVFNAARYLSQQGSLDDYIDFLSVKLRNISPGMKNYLTEAKIFNRNICDQSSSSKHPVFLQPAASNRHQAIKKLMSIFHHRPEHSLVCSA